MKAQTWIIALVLLYPAIHAPLAVCDEIKLQEDGWYRWEVPAGAGGRKSCCYRFHNGRVDQTGCRLGGGMDEYVLPEPCDIDSDTMMIHVEVRNGKVREIRPLSSACPVRSSTEIHTIESVTVQESIAWLTREADANRTVVDEAVMALSFHSREAALSALFALLENRAMSMEIREQALFWLVQSDYDEAYAYLDRLLN
jgi:hypothetical protein